MVKCLDYKLCSSFYVVRINQNFNFVVICKLVKIVRYSYTIKQLLSHLSVTITVKQEVTLGLHT